MQVPPQSIFSAQKSSTLVNAVFAVYALWPSAPADFPADSKPGENPHNLSPKTKDVPLTISAAELAASGLPSGLVLALPEGLVS